MEPEDSVIESTSVFSKDSKWRDRHVIQSQYLLQILKCAEEGCCKRRRSSLFKFLPEKGLPPPVPLEQTKDGLKISADLKENESFMALFPSLALGEKHKTEMIAKLLTYDTFCPSVQSKLEDRTCVCGRYFSSMSSLKDHLKFNSKCKKTAKKIKPKKILGQRRDEKLAFISYDNEEDVEWVYDMDLNSEEEFLEPEEPQNQHFSIEKIVEPIWEEMN